MLWVQTTLVLTSIRWYELVMGPLAARDQESYWDEGKFFAGALGVPHHLFPATLADLIRYEKVMLQNEVIPDSTAVAVARDVIRPFHWLPDGAYWPNDAITAGLLPESLRFAFDLRFGPAERRCLRAVTVAIRAARPALPRWITVVPQARRYEEAFASR
jgi:uncharacterized protein (DUF2236 family)